MSFFHQAGPARPVFLEALGNMTAMHKATGLCYAAFVSFQEDYASFNYSSRDLEEKGREIMSRVDKKSSYLFSLRKKYDAEVASFEKRFAPAFGDLSGLDDKQLFSLFERVSAEVECFLGDWARSRVCLSAPGAFFQEKALAGFQRDKAERVFLNPFLSREAVFSFKAGCFPVENKERAQR